MLTMQPLNLCVFLIKVYASLHPMYINFVFSYVDIYNIFMHRFMLYMNLLVYYYLYYVY